MDFKETKEIFKSTLKEDRLLSVLKLFENFEKGIVLTENELATLDQALEDSLGVLESRAITNGDSQRIREIARMRRDRSKLLNTTL